MKNIKLRSHFFKFLASFLSICLLLTGMIVVPNIQDVKAETPVWSGEVATSLTGDGTKSVPYKISTGEELRFVFEECISSEDASSLYFELTNDIDLNNVVWSDTYGQGVYFSSKFNGNGYTISNLNIQGTTYAGLFHQLGDGAEIKNLTIDGAIVNGTGAHAAVIAARVLAGATVTISNCFIKNATVTATTNAGGFVATNAGANGNESYLNIDNCGFIGTLTGTTTGGICANSQTYGNINVSKCYSSGADAITTSNSGRTTIEYVYTTYSGTTKSTYVSAENMQGENAKTNLVGFDFDVIWKITNTYPELRYYNPDKAVAGDAWLGGVATKFASGEGTEELPYQIATGEQLRYMFEEYVKNESNSDIYFELINDIDLNNKEWIDTVSQNNYYSSNFNGNGYTISNLNIPSSSSNIGLFHQLGNGAIIKNLTINGATINGTGTHAAVMAGRVMAGATVTISNCFIKNATVTAATNAGGFVATNAGANGNESYLNVDNCGFIGTLTGTTTGGICANSQTYGNINVSKCYSSGADAITTSNSGRTTIEYVYTTYSGTTKATYVSAENMQGENAKTNLVGFDFDVIWKTTNTYPELRYYNPDKAVAGDAWLGGVATKFAGGEGTEELPYQIATGEQLRYMFEKYVVTTSNSSVYFELINDIDLNNMPWNALNSQNPYFSSKFNGNGYTISNANIQGTTYAGLFHQLGDGAEIKNLTIDTANVSVTATSSDYAGVLAYRVKGSSTVAISNVMVKNATVTATTNAGGLLGANAGTVTIDNCAFIGTNSAASVGGICANNWGTFTVSNCYSAGVDANTKNTKTTSTTFTNVYTNNSTSTVSVKATLKDDAQMQGENAKTNLVGFDFDVIWKTTNTYPELRYYNPDKAVAGDAWLGGVATKFAGGEGTEELPYQIATGEQLRFMFEQYIKNNQDTVCYFELIANIDLNNKEWEAATSQNHYFSGIFNGNGYTISNLYSVGTTQVGLFHQLRNSAVIKNFVIDTANVSVTATSSDYAGVLAYRTNGTNVTISNVMVKNAVVTATTNAGGLLGGAAGTVTIDNCAFIGTNSAASVGGICANNWGTFTVSNCYSAGVDANTKNTKTATTTFTNVYTNNSISTVSVKAIPKDNAQMQGENAKTNLVGFNFKNIWKTTTTYPELRFINPDNIQTGSVWTGLSATKFAGGDGTEGDPYQIATAEQLYKMVSEHCVANDAQAYYILTNDIYLNDVSAVLWQKNEPNSWISIANQGYGFKGVFDGCGFTIYGLYGDFSSDVSVVRSALIPVLGDGSIVKNVHISDANISADGSNAVYLGTVAGYISSGATATIDGCSVNESVAIYTNYVKGGILGGSPANVTISNCLFKGYAGFADSSENMRAAGGIIGSVWNADCTPTIKNCYAVDYPLVGDIQNTAPFTEENSYDNSDDLSVITGNIPWDDTVWYVGDLNLPLLRSRGERIHDASGNDMLDLDDLAAIRTMLFNSSTDAIANVNADDTVDIRDLVAVDILISDESSEVETLLPENTSIDFEGYSLVWNQEFNTDQLQSNVWALTGDMSERDDLKFADTNDVLTVSGNKLNMNAIYDESTGVYTTVAGLSTKNSMSFKYGYLEIKAKVPFEIGCWPAIWTKSEGAIGATNDIYRAEVDIFEIFGVYKNYFNTQHRKYEVVPNIHKWYNESSNNHCEINSDTYNYYDMENKNPTQEHIYGFLWTETQMQFFVDGVLYDTFDITDNGNFDATGRSTDMSGFHQPMYLILNNMLYTNDVIEANGISNNDNICNGVENRANFSIDWIRLYQLSDNESEIHIK